MDARELNPEEREVLFGLVGLMTSADGRLAHGEALEIEALGEEIGCDAEAGIRDSRRRFPDRASVLAAAGSIRPGSRELVRTLLMDLAGADGDRVEAEKALVAELVLAWKA